MKKHVAEVTLIISHDQLTGDQPFQPLTTLELVTDLLGESYDFGLDIISAQSREMVLHKGYTVDTDMDRRKRAMQARLAEEREQRNEAREQ